MKRPNHKLPNRRTILRVTALEDRNHPGSAVGGLVAGVSGSLLLDPLSTMADIVGENAMSMPLSGAGTPSPDVSLVPSSGVLGSGDGSVALPQGSAQAGGAGSGGSGSGHDNYSISSVVPATGVFGDGFGAGLTFDPNALFGVSGTGGSPTASQGGSANLSQAASGGGGGNDTPATGSASAGYRSAADESGGSGGTGGTGGGSGTGSGMPGGTNPGGTGGTGSPPPGGTGGTGSPPSGGTGSPPPGGGGMPGGGTGNPGYPGGPGGGPGGMPGGTGQTASPPYKIEVLNQSEDDAVVRGDTLTFSIVTDGSNGTADGATAFGLNGIQWDFDSAQAGHSPDPTATEATVDHQMARTGECVIRATFTDPYGEPRTLSISQSVAPQGVSLAHQDDIYTSENTLVSLLPRTTFNEPGTETTNPEWWISYNGHDEEMDWGLSLTSPTKSFVNAGTYTVRVAVADTNGATAEDTFQVVVSPPSPKVTAKVDDWINEGSEATFKLTPANSAIDNVQTLRKLANPEADPNSDLMSIYVDWTGQSLLEGPPLPDALDPFEQIQKEDLAFEADGTITFKHLYDDNLGTHFKAIPYHPVIRTEDETGLKSVLPPLTLLVYNVAPVGILKVGTQISTKASSGQDLWQLPANNEISFDQVSDPSSADFDTLQYYWKETDFTPTGPLVTLWVTPESSTALQDESAQYVHRIEAWVFDKNGGQSEHKEYDLIANSPTLSAVAPNSIYGTMLLDGQKPLTGDADDKPDNYSPYYYSARAIRTKANGVHTVRLDVDAAGKTLGPLKYFFQVTYTSQVDGRQIGQQVNSYQSSDSFTTRPVENNERVTVWMAAYVQGTPPPPLGWQMAVFEGVRVQTTGEQINELWGLARQLTSSFADKAGVLLSAMDRDGILAFARTFLGASRDALSAYVQKLGSGAGLEAIFQWLGVKAPSGPTDLSADSLIALVLDYANINWETLDRVIEPVIGAGNSLAIEGISKLYADYDRTKTSGLVKFLRELPDRAAAWAGSADPESQFLKSVADDLNSALNLNAVRKLIEDQIATSFTDAIPWITVEVMAKFLPGVGAVSALIGAMKFFSENRDELFGQSRLFLDALGEFAVGGDTLRSRLAGKIELALVAVTPLFLTFGARQFGLNNVKVAVRLRVDAAVWTLEDKLQGTIAGIAGKMGGGTTTGKQALPQGGPRRDSVIAKATLLTDIKGHPGEKYMLSEVQVTGTAKLKLEEVRTDGKPAKNWILSDKSFYTPGTWATSINTDGRKFIESTRLPVGTSKARPRPAVGGVAPPGSQPPGGSNPNRPTVVKSGDLQKPVLDKLDRIRAEIKQNSCKELGTGCFAAGTLLSTPTGLKAIESFVSGDAILSQDEYDPRSGIVTRWVEEVFRRYAPVLGVHLRRKGDRRPMVIRSTSEHPFYVSDEKYIGKWVAAGELQEGQWVLCDDGRWARVEEVADTGEWEVVYNMRVADSHTYFVGEEGRGYAVWVHNAYLENMNRTAFVATTEIVAVDRAARERYKLANDKNVAVFKLKLPSGDTEYWVAASTSADIFRIRVTETLSPGSNGLPRPEKTFSGLGQLPLTDLQPFYFRFKSESSRPVVSPHSEEKLMAALNQKAAQAPVGQKYTLQEVFSEYAPCSNATHDHKCAFRLYEWSKSACGTNIEISTSNVLFSELHPNAPTAADRDASPFVDPDGLLSGYVSKANGPTLHNYFQGQISRKIRVKETIPNADNNSDDLGKFYWGMLDQQKIKASYRWHEIGAVHFNP